MQGEKEAEAEDEGANLFEPERLDDDGEALQESDVEDGAVMVAVPLKGKGAADESVVSDRAQKEKKGRLAWRAYQGAAGVVWSSRWIRGIVREQPTP